MSNLNLRSLQRISYSEWDELDFDEYVFCTECADYVVEYCAIHGPMLVIPDDKVPEVSPYPPQVPRAALTIPHVFLHFAESDIPGAGIGVFSTLSLPKDVRFGPYRGQITHDVTTDYCWQIYGSAVNRRCHVIDAGDENNSNWLRYVNCSRHSCEQNLLAYQFRGEIYYRTIKIIPRNTELLLFYGSEFANRLGVDLSKYNIPIDQIRRVTNEPKELNEHTNLEENDPSTTLQTVEINEVGSSYYEDEENNYDPIQEFSLENFPCNKCNTVFNDVCTLENHITTCGGISSKVLYECSECDFKSTKINYYKKHMTLHDKNRQHVCTICGLRFQFMYNLRRHTKTHANANVNDEIYKGKMFPCKICGRKCTSKESLKRHLLHIHLGLKPYMCELCPYKSTRFFYFNNHMINCHADSMVRCKICGFPLKNMSALTVHVNNAHNGSSIK